MGQKDAKSQRWEGAERLEQNCLLDSQGYSSHELTAAVSAYTRTSQDPVSEHGSTEWKNVREPAPLTEELPLTCRGERVSSP